MYRTWNPQASPALTGIPSGAPPGARDVGFDYIYDVVLTANQLRTDSKPIDNTSAFHWRAIVIVANTGIFRVRFSDSRMFYMSNGFINNTNLLGTPGNPWPVFPEVVIPPGGRIGVEIEDLSVAGNTIQLAFRGVRRYRQQLENFRHVEFLTP